MYVVFLEKNMLIYKLINKVNGDFYIGKTIYNVGKRLIGHRAHATKGSHYYIHNAMRYYGYDNFYMEILEEIDDEILLNEREIYWIKELNPVYNSHKGGQGGSKSGRPDLTGQSRENWLQGFNRKGKEPWNKGKTGLGGYKHSKPRTQDNRDKISVIQKNSKSTCKYCGFISNPGNIGKWHNDKCKHKVNYE